MGLLLVIVVHTADIQDRDGAKLVFAKARNRFPRLRSLWADGGYAGELIKYVFYWYLIVLQIVKRTDPLPGFKVLPRRWVVERTFGWLMNYRRLCRHYEYWPETGEAIPHHASTACLSFRTRSKTLLFRQYEKTVLTDRREIISSIPVLSFPGRIGSQSDREDTENSKSLSLHGT